jgi:protein-L-isoaspartate(D-aspartate) O-methyltransferase
MDLERERERMVAEQLRGRGITDARVLEAMRTVPRDRFIPSELADRAYGDFPLPIAARQTISQPYMVALMTQTALLTGAERVLEIGTGSGYQTAVLARLAAEVYSVELVEELYQRARRTLQELEVANCAIRLGDGADGWPEAAPFDVIIVTAATPGIPRPLLDQLSAEGRLIAPIGEEELQTLVRVARRDGMWSEEYFGECVFVKMAGRAGFKD